MLRGQRRAAEEALKKLTDQSAERSPLERSLETPPGGSGTRLEGHLEKAARILEAALERNAQMPVVMDVRAITSFADAFVLLTGRSDRQVRAIAEGIVEALHAAGDEPLGIEGMDEGRWVLIDCNDVVVHVFDPETRDLYALERLWSDAKPVELETLGLSPEAIEAAGVPVEGGARTRRRDGV